MCTETLASLTFEASSRAAPLPHDGANCQGPHLCMRSGGARSLSLSLPSSSLRLALYGPPESFGEEFQGAESGQLSEAWPRRHPNGDPERSATKRRPVGSCSGPWPMLPSRQKSSASTRELELQHSLRRTVSRSLWKAGASRSSRVVEAQLCEHRLQRGSRLAHSCGIQEGSSRETSPRRKCS